MFSTRFDKKNSQDLFRSVHPRKLGEDAVPCFVSISAIFVSTEFTSLGFCVWKACKIQIDNSVKHVEANVNRGGGSSQKKN